MKKPSIYLFAISIWLTGCAAVPAQPIQSPYQELHDQRLKEVERMATEVELGLQSMPPQELLNKAQAAITYGFKDPDSAKFRNVRYVKYEERIVICGEVNAKNSYGGYVGYENFIAGLSSWKLMKESDNNTALGSADSVGVRIYCRLGKAFSP